MKQIIIMIGAIMTILFHSCTGKKPTHDDILGIWKSPEKAELIFNSDGTFTGSSIPAEFGFFPVDSFKNVKFDGTGKWVLRKGNTHWEVYLDFHKVSVNKNSCAFPVFIAGEKGVLENKPPWYLFVWEEEEGGERHKFSKQ